MQIKRILSFLVYVLLYIPNICIRAQSVKRSVVTLDVKYNNTHTDISISRKIWMYWGDELPPNYVQKIRANVVLLNPECQVVLLSRKSIGEYIDDYMLNMEGISEALISDFIRLELLYKYGGIWIDATSIFFRDFSWVFELFKVNSYDFVGYYRSIATIDKNFPVFESWFIASKEKNPFIGEWLKELKKTIPTGVARYIGDVKEKKDAHLYFQNIDDPEYFVIYVAAQIAMRKIKNFSFYVRNSDETGLFYQDINKWKSYKVALVLCAQKLPFTPPEIIKLTRIDRKNIDWVINARLWSRKSIISKIMK